MTMMINRIRTAYARSSWARLLCSAHAFIECHPERSSRRSKASPAV